MNETIISWNVANWITVVLMAILGFALIGAGTNFVMRVKGGANETN